MPAYSFASNEYSDSNVLGFFVLRSWEIAVENGPVNLTGKNYIGLLVSSDSDAAAKPGRSLGAPMWGVGKLTNSAGAVLVFNDCRRLNSSYGEYSNEFGPGIVLASFSDLTMNGWLDPVPDLWADRGPNAGSGHALLRHSLYYTAGGQNSNFEICSPRVSFAGGNTWQSASVTRYFCDEKVNDLLTNGPPNEWKLSQIGIDVTPGNGVKGVHFVCHGLFRSLGWHLYGRVRAAANAAANANTEMMSILEEIVSTSGSLPRNLENADDHHGEPNAPVELNEPAMEVLYWTK